MSTRRPAAALAVLGALSLALAACTGASEPDPEDGPHEVGVQLFQWTWEAIAAECESTLGPAGYGWVMTSPPQEHILGEQWWTSYQPVSYLVESRLGTREELADMVSRCEAAGVAVYVDAVVNHMTGAADDAPEATGWAGSSYTHYNYPGIWTEEDFHHCGRTPDDDIADYRDSFQVRDCELVNLADLATEEDHVREQLAAYLADLVSLGVSGLRIDAAKHMPPEDIAAIVADLPDDVAILQEVIRAAGEPVTPEQYVDAGLVYEFAWGENVVGMVESGSIRSFADLGSTGMLASEDAVIFVDNHDTERNGQTLNATDGATYLLANVLMLGGPYGTPVVYSGYAFSDRDAGPQQDQHGAVLDATCPTRVGAGLEQPDGEWVCTHAWPAVAGMVGFHNATFGEPLTDRWDDARQIAFGRGEAGFLVVNKDDEPYAGTWTTSLPPGRYCDVISGPPADGECAGEVLEIADDGTLTAVVPAASALALHVLAPAPAP